MIKIYKVREERLGAGFSDIAHIIYLNLYKQLLIIKKVSGESLRFYHQNHFEYDAKKVASLLHECLLKVHQPIEYASVSSHFENANWCEQVTSYTTGHIDYLTERNLLSMENKNIILSFLKEHTKNLEEAHVCLLHGDLNDETVCYNSSTNEVELRKVENVMAGDIVYEYTRMWQYRDLDVFDTYLKLYCKDIEKEAVFPFYIVYFHLMTFVYEHMNDYNYTSTKNNLDQSILNLKKN